MSAYESDILIEALRIAADRMPPLGPLGMGRKFFKDLAEEYLKIEAALASNDIEREIPLYHHPLRTKYCPKIKTPSLV